MENIRFTEAEIAIILKQAESGLKTDGAVSSNKAGVNHLYQTRRGCRERRI